MQHPWATFSSIKWGEAIYKADQLVSIYLFSESICVYSDYYVFYIDAYIFFIQVKSQKTQPILYGKVVKFLLYGDHKGDVFATGGEVEVVLVRRKLLSVFEKVIKVCLTQFFLHVNPVSLFILSL